MRRLTGLLGLSLRRLRSDAPIAVSIAAVVAGTSFLFAAAPLRVNAIADEGLRFSLRTAKPLERNLELGHAGRIAGVQGIPQRAAEYERALHPDVRTALAERTYSVETPLHSMVVTPGVPEPRGVTRYVNLRLAERAPDRVVVVAGRLPQPTERTIVPPFPGEQTETPVIELAVSAETAAQLQVEMGDRLFLAPAAEDPLVRAVPLSAHRFVAVEVTGLIRVRNPESPYWPDSRLAEPAIRDTETRRYIYAAALFAPDAYPDMLAALGPLPVRYSWRYLLDPDRLDAGLLGELQGDIESLEALLGAPRYGAAGDVYVRTGLTRVIQRFDERRDATEAVLAVGGLGVLASALAVVGLLAGLATQRRADAIGLVRGRGGSLVQVVAGQFADALLVAAPAGILGALAALALVDGRSSTRSWWLVGAVVLGTALVIGAGALRPARRNLVPTRRDEGVVSGVSPRRLALELAVAVAAGAGVYLLRRRGAAGGGDGGIDPYLAGVPVLLGLAVGLVLLRLQPWPLRAFARAAAGRRDLVVPLALNRSARQPAAGGAPLLVILLAVSVAVFGSAVANAVGASGSASPFAADLVGTLRTGIVATALYAAFAVVLTATLTWRARARDLAFLRTLGVTRRQSVVLTALELGPTVAAALVLGLGLGLAVAALLEPGLRLGVLAGPETGALRPSLFGLALLLGALVAALALALAATAALARRANLARELRLEVR